jgi:POT family proton-dependent oligopeptide transporter
MSATSQEKHPKGLYVLFAAEMWERFSFYSMLALFVLYLESWPDGFGWNSKQSAGLYANYMMFVYASPLIGGWLADRKLGFRKAAMIGGVFFVAGHLLLAVRSVNVMYAALACLVIGNGFFKPNISSMVGALYPEGSQLKDRAYNIFYLGINVGAFLGPLVVGFWKAQWGVHAAFAVAAAGMVVSVLILWLLKGHIMAADGVRACTKPAAAEAPSAMDAIPENRRIFALIVIYAIVIVFWMVFHQNGSTLTKFAEHNTDWSVGGTVSNSINPFFVLTLTFPLVLFWRWLGKRGLEPSTPAKMAMGMTLTAASFYIMYFAGISGGDTGRVSPLWLISAYAVVTLGELMLSPMGLSLVSKVAPARHRGLMMGGWFVATAIGNKLTMIGVYWDDWKHSSFFVILATCALFMAVVLAFLLRPLKRAMPGV